MNFSLQLGKFSVSLGKKSVTGSGLEWLRGGNGGDTDGASLTNSFQQSAWVYACVQLLADTVAGLKFRIVQGSEDNQSVIEGGAAVDLFNRPHPQYSSAEFWTTICQWAGLRGEAFVVALDANFNPTRTDAANVRYLLPLSPDHLTARVEAHALYAWQYSGSPTGTLLESQFLDPAEVIHFRLPNPFNAWRGMAPTTVAWLSAQTDYAAAQYMKGLMINNADTGVIVTTDQQPDEPQRLAITEALKERKRRAGTADRPLFLWGGATVTKPGLAVADAQVLETRKANRQEICAIYFTPQELLGYTEDANRSVGDAARLNFIENRVGPFCERLTPAFQRLVAREGKDVRCEFHIKAHPAMVAAQRSRWAAAVVAFGIGVSRNECNALFDLGMKNDPSGDKRYLPFSLQPVEDDGSFPEEPAATPVPATPAAEAGKLIDDMLCILKESGKAGERGSEKSHQCGPASSAYARAIQGSVRRKKSVMRNFFVGQQARVLAKLEKIDRSTINIQRSSYFADIAKAVDDIFNLIAENEALLKKMTPLLKGDLLFGGSQVWKELGLNPADFAIPPQKAIDFLAKRTKEIGEINNTTFEKLKSSLAEGLKDGDTHAELVDRVKEVYSGATEARAETIATTETNIAVNSGRFEGMQEAGVERKGWQATNLEGVRPEHLQAELDYQDEGVPLDEPFIVAGEELMHPGDPSGSAGNVINCRCFTFAILPEKTAKDCQPRNLLTFEDFISLEAARGVRA